MEQNKKIKVEKVENKKQKSQLVKLKKKITTVYCDNLSSSIFIYSLLYKML